MQRLASPAVRSTDYPMSDAVDATQLPGILETLAARVRALRGRLGWTRAELASRCGLSVRFLARVESGDGNISVLRLQALAASLGTTADRLVRPGAAARRRLALVGMRGAGKSTVGPALAERLGLPFLEMDRMITEASGLPLDQIFEMHGERHYRRMEREALLRALGADGPAVLAASGGIVHDPVSWELLLERTTVVWLRARPEDHWNRVIAQGDRRPMADNPEALDELRAMLAARERSYGAAHVRVDTSGLRPEAVVDAICAALEAAPSDRASD